MRFAGLVLLVATACVSTGRGRQMEARIARLEQEDELVAKQLDEQRAAIRDRVAMADRKIAEVQKKLDELNAVAHRTGADLAVNQDKLTEDLRGAKGQLEEEQHRLQTLASALDALKADVDARFAALKGAGALEEYEARKKAATLQRPAEKGAFFALAQKQEEAGEKPVARELYQEFVKRWPVDPKTADAYFRLGEIAFGDKRYRESILAYGHVAEDFPRSDKAPDALYRIAEAMLQIDLKDDARGVLEKLVERYPKTSAASKAKARLAELAPPPPPTHKKKQPARRQ